MLGIEKVLEFAKTLPPEMPSTNALPVTVEEFILETERQTGKVNYTKVVIQVSVSRRSNELLAGSAFLKRKNTNMKLII